jgi:hypothetical protein
VADNPNALLLAQAEREKRQRAAPKETKNNPTFLQNVGELMSGIGRPLAGLVDMAMSPVAFGYEKATGKQARGVSYNIPQAGAYSGQPDSAYGAAGEYMGMAMPFAAGLPALGSTLPRAARSGAVRTFLDNIAKTATRFPKTYFSSEAAAAAGAGALGQMAERGGAGPTGRLGAELAGSLAGGVVAGVPAGLRAAKEGLTASLAPMSQEGGMIRAARQMQERAGGAEAAQRAAISLNDIPEGVSPAQWIGDERLMAQEARLLTDNPELANQVKAELQEARMAAQSSLMDSFGRPRSRQDWERAVLEMVTPTGTVIEPGMTDDMLDQAYRSFEPLYAEARGFDIPTSGLTGRLSRAVMEPSIIATDKERKTVKNWFNSLATSFDDQIEFDEISSDALLQMRSKVRDQRRLQSKRGNEERADLLGAIDGEITGVLEANVPDYVVDILKRADSQYRKYKVIENAIYNAGDSALTPDQLSQSIRMGGLTSTSRYARGVDPATQELRIAALAGRSTEEVLGDPRRAALFVRGLDDEGKKAVQADFINVLVDRAKNRATDATDAGIPFVSGAQLTRDLRENRAVLSRLGMSQTEINRAESIARQITVMERRSPAAVSRLFTDGPASIIELAATLAGAKSGQKIAGRGLGSSLVLAQYMSNRARGILAGLTSDQATKLMTDAVTDPKLYRAILTKSIVSPTKDRQTAQYLESWLLASAYDKTKDEEQ